MLPLSNGIISQQNPQEGEYGGQCTPSYFDLYNFVPFLPNAHRERKLSQ